MGQQLVTSSSDGLVKLWNIRDEECVKTLDNHEDKVSCVSVQICSEELTELDMGFGNLSG